MQNAQLYLITEFVIMQYEFMKQLKIKKMQFEITSVTRSLCNFRNIY